MVKNQGVQTQGRREDPCNLDRWRAIITEPSSAVYPSKRVVPKPCSQTKLHWKESEQPEIVPAKNVSIQVPFHWPVGD